MKTDGLIMRVKSGINCSSCPETGRCPGHHICRRNEQTVCPGAGQKSKLVKGRLVIIMLLNTSLGGAMHPLWLAIILYNLHFFPFSISRILELCPAYLSSSIEISF
jgi:hypothetical protein